MATEADDFKKVGIEADLDEGKKCCFVIGLEQGYNIIGVTYVFGIFFWLYVLGFLYMISSILSTLEPDKSHPELILPYIYVVWNIILPIVWFIGFLARRRGDAPAFKRFVKIFFYMYVIHILLGVAY